MFRGLAPRAPQIQNPQSKIQNPARPPRRIASALCGPPHPAARVPSASLRPRPALSAQPQGGIDLAPRVGRQEPFPTLRAGPTPHTQPHVLPSATAHVHVLEAQLDFGTAAERAPVTFDPDQTSVHVQSVISRTLFRKRPAAPKGALEEGGARVRFPRACAACSPNPKSRIQDPKSRASAAADRLAALPLAPAFPYDVFTFSRFHANSRQFPPIPVISCVPPCLRALRNEHSLDGPARPRVCFAQPPRSWRLGG